MIAADAGRARRETLWGKVQSVFFVTPGRVLVTGFLLPLVALGFVRAVF